VNLVKSGIPSPEIMCSLADAIVMQNLSVLTRGNTLRHKVLLLGLERLRKRLPFLNHSLFKVPHKFGSTAADVIRFAGAFKIFA